MNTSKLLRSPNAVLARANDGIKDALIAGIGWAKVGYENRVNKGYIYFAMGFSLGVEFLNIRALRKAVTNPA